MGYHSDVRMLISGPPAALSRFVEAFCKVYPEKWQSIITTFLPTELKITENKIHLVSKHIKWYDGFPNVDAMNDLWAAAYDRSDVLTGIYVTLGEDPDDWFQEAFGTDNEVLSAYYRECSIGGTGFPF